MQRLETALDDRYPRNLPRPDRLRGAGSVNFAEIAAIEQVPDHPFGSPLDHHRIRLRQRLQVCGQAGRLADDVVAARAVDVRTMADDHKPGGNPDSTTQCGIGTGPESS